MAGASQSQNSFFQVTQAYKDRRKQEGHVATHCAVLQELLHRTEYLTSLVSTDLELEAARAWIIF